MLFANSFAIFALYIKLKTTIMRFGTTEIILIVLLFVLLFGAKKIPELMRGMGRGVKEFKDAVSKDYNAEDADPTENKSDKPAPTKREE